MISSHIKTIFYMHPSLPVSYPRNNHNSRHDVDCLPNSSNIYSHVIRILSAGKAISIFNVTWLALINIIISQGINYLLFTILPVKYCPHKPLSISYNHFYKIKLDLSF